MNAMSWRWTSSRVRLAPLALAVLLAATSVTAAEAEKKAEESPADIERKLEEARMRLDTAAREVAELSMSMSEHAVPFIPFANMRQDRGMLGINLGPQDLADGVTVLSVSPGGAAEDAGLKAGDVLLEVHGQALKREANRSPRDQLWQLISALKPGDRVDVRYRRGKEAKTVQITAQPSMDRAFSIPPMAVRGRVASPAIPLAPLAYMRAVGVFGSAELVPLTPKLGQYFGTDKGLLVVRAPSDSRLKLEEGDVIVDIDGRTPANPTHAFRILGSYQPGEQLKLNVLRQKKRMSFEITVPDEPSARRGGPMMFHHPDGMPMPMPAPGMRHDEIMLAPGPMPPPLPPEAGAIRLNIIDEPA